jgi:hypothetical protein
MINTDTIWCCYCRKYVSSPHRCESVVHGTCYQECIYLTLSAPSNVVVFSGRRSLIATDQD